MFEKYLSLLPYNPSLIHQMGFYGRRMRQEAAVRRTGMFFVIATFAVQFFAVLAPPTSAATGPNNNLLANGFSSIADATNDCNNNTQDYKTILNYYGISCTNVANATQATISSRGGDGKYFSMGRFSYPNLQGNQPVTIGNQTYYVRYLWAWDTAGASTYKAIHVVAGDGTGYDLLYGCGNLVSIGVPQPPKTIAIPTPPPVVSTYVPPKLGLIKSTLVGYPAANTQVTPGTKVGYRVYITNGGGEADFANLNDTLPAGLDFVSQSLNGGATLHTYNTGTHTVEYSWSSIPKYETSYYVDIVAQVSASDSNGQKICNTASAGDSSGENVKSNQVCLTVVVPTTTTPAPAPTVTTTVPTPAPVTPTPTPTTPTPTPTAPTPTTPTVPTCLYDTSLPASSPDCKVCQNGTSSTDILSCVANSKTATNQTENIADANNTTAQPGDVITYTLTAHNYAKATASQYSFQENLGDVLVYADPVDLHGGTLDSLTGGVTWPAVDIPSGQSATEQVTVKVKDPIPSGVSPATDQGEYDLTMTNVFGNTVNIKVPPAPTQGVVTAAAALPNTGPGSSLFILAGIMLIGGYFYSRARLLAHESAIAVKEASN